MNETCKNNLQTHKLAQHNLRIDAQSTQTTASFAIKNWAAWHTTLRSQEAWLKWAQQPVELIGTDIPQLTSYSAAIRRRVHRLGKLALQVLSELPPTHAPILFCSRFGELDRSFSLLKELTESGQVSPQAFSLAVHNAIPSLFTIEQASNVNLTALASHSSVFTGIIEALGLFTQGEQQVRLIYCEDIVPEYYTQFINGPQTSYAFALDLIPEPSFQLHFKTDTTPTAPLMLPPDLAMLRFLISDQSEFSAQVDCVNWCLQRC